MDKTEVVKRWEVTLPDGKKVAVVKASDYDALLKRHPDLTKPFFNYGEGHY